MSCGVGHRCSSDPVLLWLWCRPKATALIRPLAWELPYAAGAVLKSRKKKKKHTKQQQQQNKTKQNTTWELTLWRIREKIYLAKGTSQRSGIRKNWVPSRNGKKAKMSKGVGVEKPWDDAGEEHEGRTCKAVETEGGSKRNGKPPDRGVCKLHF